MRNAPDRREDILGQLAKIKEGLDTGNLEEARQDLLAFGQLIKELAAGDSVDSDSDETRRWSAAKKKWAANKQSQLAEIKETMNILGNYALDEEMDAEKVNSLLSELSTYVPSYRRCADALDTALDELDESAELSVRLDGYQKLNAAITDMEQFYTGPRIQQLLRDFDGLDFFDPTREALAEMSQLLS